VTQQEGLDLIRSLLKARDEDELWRLVSLHLSSVDATFFENAEAAARALERQRKPQVAAALRGLADHMLSMKTLI